MTKYLISFDDGAMTFPEEELPDVSAACARCGPGGQARRRVCVRRRAEGPRGSERGGHRRGDHQRPIPGEQAVPRRIRSRGSALTRRGAGVGCQARGRLPMRPRGSRDPVRPDRLIADFSRSAVLPSPSQLCTQSRIQGVRFLPRKKREIPGNDLLSHPVARAVPSALVGLTAVFGMGTGVSPPL
jgi:hypothetical protein